MMESKEQIQAASHREKLRELFKRLSESDVNNETGFSADKDAILKVFENTKNETKEDILVRLTLIDSMYSTQMSRRYYALEELAEFLAILSEGKQGKLRQKFLDFVKEPEKKLSFFNSIFKERDEKGELVEVKKNLFSECYGIGKDGRRKGVAISLISKYAYFETDFQFPIYDSIACEMYPLVWCHCGFDKKSMPKLKCYNDEGNILGDKTIVEYVKAVNVIIEKLESSHLNYDRFDRFLWFVGKIRRGNLSLVLSREDYLSTINLYHPQKYNVKTRKGKTKSVTEYFNINNVEIYKLSYLDNNPLLREFFEFAQYYGHTK